MHGTGTITGIGSCTLPNLLLSYPRILPLQPYIDTCWLRQDKCPGSFTTNFMAASKGHPLVTQWASTLLERITARTSAALRRSANLAETETCQWGYNADPW